MIRLVIADDEAVIRNGVARTLETLGKFEILKAENGEQTVELVLQNRADALILDIHMPRLDGIEVMQRLIDAAYCPEVFVLSGYNEFSYAQKMLKFGVIDYLLKPIDRADVLKLGERIEARVLQKRQARAQLELYRNRSEMLSALMLPALNPNCASGRLYRRLEKLAQQLVMAADRNPERARALMREGFDGIAAAEPTLRRCYAQYFALSVIGELNGAHGDARPVGDLDRCIQRVYELESGGEFESWLGDLLDRGTELGRATGKQLYYRRAKAYIDAHYTEDISVQSIAEYLAITPNYLGRVFKEHGEMGISEYIKQCRIRYGAHLLSECNLSISETAARIGIPDQRYFSQLFREAYGMTPRAYRKQGKR